MNDLNYHYLVEDLPRGTGEEGFPPDARWMLPENILTKRDYAYYYETGDRVLLGQYNPALECSPALIGYKDDAHIITVAGSRAGKGVSAIIPNLIYYRGSMLVIDPKGENANLTAKHRAEELGQKVVVLDPFKVTKDHVAPYRASFNPMSFLRIESETIVEDAGLIADALVIPSGGDSHWDDTARNFIEGVILHIATSPAFEGRRTLGDVRDCLIETNGEEHSPLIAAMLENEEAYGVIIKAASDLSGKPENERGSVLSTARRHTKFLDFPKLQSVLQDHDFDLAELKSRKEGMTIFLCLPAGRMGVCSAWFRLFINLALEAMEHGTQKTDIPCLFILDEFAILGHMKQIEDAAGQIAGFGVKLWPILQDLGQLKALYKDRWQTFMGNAGILQFFGNNDVETLEYITRRLGKTSIRVERQSDTTGGQRESGGSGLSWALESHDLITPEEAARYFGKNDEFKRELIILAGKDPMILERIIYYKHDLFKDMVD